MKNNILKFSGLIYVIALIVLMSSATCSSEEDDSNGEDYLMFSAPSPVTPDNPGEMGKIVITASGGTLPYEFYVIPEVQWIAGDKMQEMLQDNNLSRLDHYTYTRGLYGSHTMVLEVAPGTQINPRYYWVAVQDEKEFAPITGTNMLSWWKKIAVIGNE
jgi:hypothetical protein